MISLQVEGDGDDEGKEERTAGWIHQGFSTVDQSTARQLDGVALDETFTDKTSGKDTNRPALQAALKHLRSGDVLVVHSLDRLARNLRDLLEAGRGAERARDRRRVRQREPGVRGRERPPRWPSLQLQMMGAFAEFERSLIHERQREGIAIAKANGVYAGHGRPRKMNAATVEIIRGRVATGENVSAIAREFGVSRPTLYRALRRLGGLETMQHRYHPEGGEAASVASGVRWCERSELRSAVHEGAAWRRRPCTAMSASATAHDNPNATSFGMP